MREILTADRTYFVAAAGSNTNSGLSYADAFATVNYAQSVIANSLDQAGHKVTIAISGPSYPLTWTENIQLSGPFNGPVRIQSQNDWREDVVLAPSSGTALTVEGPNNVEVSGFTFWPPNGALGLSSILNAVVTASGCLWTGNGSSSGSYQAYASRGGYLELTGSHVVSGGAGYWLGSSHRGEIRLNAATVAFGINIPFSIVAYALGCAEIVVTNGSTISGSATGARYYADGGWIQWAGGSATSIPGNVAGATANGGTYFT